MTNSKKSLSLKTLLALDAATCAAMGALLLLGSAPIGEATLVVLGNLLWIAASIFLPTAGLVAPNPLGWAFLFGQVGIVAILTKFEFDTLRGEMIAA